MTILNRVTFDSVLGITDYLEKLKDTMVSFGWTLHDFEQNVEWQSGGFIAGNESFLQISTTGYGSQSFFVRIRTQVDAGDPLSDNLQIGMHKTSVFSTATSIHPVSQGNWNSISDASNSYSPTSIPMLWIFGNDKVIFTVAQHSNTQVVFQYFGLPEMFDETMAEGEFCAINSTFITKWYTGNQRFPFDGILEVFYDGVLSSTTGNNTLRSFNATTDTILNGSFGHSAEGIENDASFSERRLLEKQIVYLKDTDGQYFPHGLSWVRRCYAGDIAIGTEISFGAKKYIVFPNADNLVSEIGVAVRIS